MHKFSESTVEYNKAKKARTVSTCSLQQSRFIFQVNRTWIESSRSITLIYQGIVSRLVPVASSHWPMTLICARSLFNSVDCSASLQIDRIKVDAIKQHRFQLVCIYKWLCRSSPSKQSSTLLLYKKVSKGSITPFLSESVF